MKKIEQTTRRIKQSIFDHHLLILLASSMFLVFLVIMAPPWLDSFEEIVAAFGFLASFFYFIQKQQLEELEMFRELFENFNKRYDCMNEILNEIKQKTEGLSDAEKTKLYDYFNLCSEEYLFFKRGHIFPEVWKAWCNGMKDYLDSNKNIRDLWNKEEETDSYYGLTSAIIARDAAKKK